RIPLDSYILRWTHGPEEDVLEHDLVPLFGLQCRKAAASLRWRERQPRILQVRRSSSRAATILLGYPRILSLAISSGHSFTVRFPRLSNWSVASGTVKSFWATRDTWMAGTAERSVWML